MSNYLEASDFSPYIKDRNLTQLLDGESMALDHAQATAVTTIRDALFQWYDVDAIFALTGDARPKQVVRWVACLTLYYLYERLPSAVMPQRIKDNYDEVIKWLTDIEDAKKPVDLPHKLHPDGSGSMVNTTKFRWGKAGQTRTHNF